MTEETLKMIAQRLEAFQKGFEMMTKNLSDTLAKVEKQTEELAQSAKFIPKMVEVNQRIKKASEQLLLIGENLERRLGVIIKERGY
jgi:NADH:ubiquinone oxidoreductase subunit D